MIVERVKEKGWTVRIYGAGSRKNGRLTEPPMYTHRVVAYDRDHARRKVVAKYDHAAGRIITVSRVNDDAWLIRHCDA